MSKVLYSDWMRLYKNKIMLIGLPVGIILFAFINMLTSRLMCELLDKGKIIADMNMIIYPNQAALILAVIVSAFFSVDFVEGTIRNKLVVGEKRSYLLLSSCIISSCIAIFLQAIYSGISYILGNLLLSGFSTDPKDLFISSVVFAAAGVTLSVMFTVVIYILGNTKAALIINPSLAVVFSASAQIILSKLYPDNGVCTLSGFRLQLYTFVDRYVPFFHLTGFPRWDVMSYVYGNIITIAVSLFLGLWLFGREEIK